ncbi:MAG: hypothetical protein ACKOK7_06290, partial [Solirubrobacterales bacterium]
AGSAWFASRFRRVAPEFEPAAIAHVAAPLAWGVGFGALAGAWCLGAVALVPAGWALIPVAVGMAAAAFGFLRFGLGVGPRELFRSLGGE